MRMTPYSPILGVELGTLDGLATTSDRTRAALTPLFDARGPAAERIPRLLDALQEAWGKGRQAMFDFGEARRDQRVDDGRLLFAWLLDEARGRGMQFIPVTGLRRSASHQLAVADAAHADGLGAALRLALSDFDDLRALEANTAAIPELLDLPPDAIDVVVDFGHVVDGELGLLIAMARAVLAAVTRAGAWRSLIVAASALPAGSATSATAAQRLVPAVTRTEWQLWRALAGTVTGRPLRFADYGAQWPTPTYGDSLGTRLGAQRKIYYTSETEWVVVDPAAGSLGELVRRPVFRGPAHCAGDAFLAEHSHGGDTPESAGETAWRAAATVHHLTVVVEQLTAAGAAGAAA